MKDPLSELKHFDELKGHFSIEEDLEYKNMVNIIDDFHESIYRG